MKFFTGSKVGRHEGPGLAHRWFAMRWTISLFSLSGRDPGVSERLRHQGGRRCAAGESNINERFLARSIFGVVVKLFVKNWVCIAESSRGERGLGWRHLAAVLRRRHRRRRGNRERPHHAHREGRRREGRAADLSGSGGACCHGNLTPRDDAHVTLCLAI